MNARQAAVRAITPLLNNTGSLKFSFKKHSSQCAPNEKPLMQEFCYGSLRFYPQIKLIISKLIDKPLKKKDADVYAIIFIGIYQLYKMRIPEHAAISETVDLCKFINKKWATALVNASLRTFQRNQTELIDELIQNDVFKYNHPEWLIHKLKSNWPSEWANILHQNDQHPPLTLRVNTNKVSRETIKQQLSSNGIDVEETIFSDQGLRLVRPTDITQTEAFIKGLISVQDEAAQLAASLMSIKRNENILDACSAPGGKLTHLLEKSEGINVKVQGIELEQFRADRIKENLERVGLTCKLHISSAASKEWWDGKEFDKILLDAPCSATGVIRRNPDIKLLRQPEDIHQIAKLQMEILENLWTMLKKGGKLVYATCSVFTQENEKMIKRFITQNKDAQHIEIKAQWGNKREHGIQLFPTENGNDGFYYAVIKKIVE